MQKTIWITGASSGIGREFARRYAAMGCRLILTARRADRLQALAKELHAAHGTECRIETADLSRAEECSRLCEVLAEEHIDIFINNAGFGVCGSILETEEAREEEMIQVNVAAMARLFRAVVRKMHAQGGGTILNVASSAGLLPGGPYMAGYYASKAYVVSMTRGVAEELREMHSPVYVCALCPGPVDTEFNDRAGVVFALRGITPELCVEEALLGMMHRKTIIVPSAFMRLCTSAQRLVPIPLLMPIVARQQKKKLGKKTKIVQTSQQAQIKPGYLVHRDKVRQPAQTIALKSNGFTYCFAAEKRKSKESTTKLHKNVP